jgi:hypothetical protein
MAQSVRPDVGLARDAGLRGGYRLGGTPAAGASARTGVRLDGQWLDRSAEWQGTPLSEVVTPTAGRLRIVVPRYSAALVSARLAGARQR